jgi:hypothetical protein
MGKIYFTFNRVGALQVLKSHRTNVVSYEYPHLLRQQAKSIFAFEIFQYKNVPA